MFDHYIRVVTSAGPRGTQMSWASEEMEEGRREGRSRHRILVMIGQYDTSQLPFVSSPYIYIGMKFYIMVAWCQLNRSRFSLMMKSPTRCSYGMFWSLESLVFMNGHFTACLKLSISPHSRCGQRQQFLPEKPLFHSDLNLKAPHLHSRIALPRILSAKW